MKYVLTLSGSYNPTNYGSDHWHNYYRRSVAHNTIVVRNGQDDVGGGISTLMGLVLILKLIYSNILGYQIWFNTTGAEDNSGRGTTRLFLQNPGGYQTRRFAFLESF